ncbi:hypothetical protein [Mesobaculum littorinae]|uniref:hypothetical protein n=1 Tax=Mesobaculum littorinae TaxID=2486419 RepID=UPI0013E368A8|nr:hypothetical protein [Mesobaculum littorinae]
MAGSSVIGALRVNLGLDSAQFSRGVRQAQGATDRLGRQFKQLAGLGSVVATALGGVTLATARTANEVTKLAQLSNATPQAFQRMAAGAKTVGIEQDKLSDILKDTNDRIGDFLQTGGGEMADFFEKIAPRVGVTADQFSRLSGPEALQLYVSSLEKAGVNQQEMTFYMESLADEATALLPLLANGGVEMERLGARAQSLGTVMDERTRAAMADLRLATIGIGSAFAGLRNRVAVELAPAMTALADAFTTAMMQGGTLRAATDALIGNLERLSTYAVTLTGLMGARYAKALITARGATTLLAGSLGVLRGAIMRTGFGAIVVGAGELVYQFGRLTRAAGGIGAALGLLQDVALQSFQNIDTFSQALVDALAGTAASIASHFVGAFARILGAWDDVIGHFTAKGVPRWLFTFRKEGSDAAATLKSLKADLDTESGARFKASTAGFEAAAPAIAEIRELVAGLGEVEGAAGDGTDALDHYNDALGGAGGDGSGGTAGAAKAAGRALKEMQGEIQRLEFDADPAKDYRAELAKLGKLKVAGLSDRAYAKAVAGLNNRLVESVPLVGDLSTVLGDLAGTFFTDWTGALDGAWRAFQGWISNVASAALRARIAPSIAGITAGGAGTAAAAQGASGAAGAGVLGGLGANASGFLGGWGGAAGTAAAGTGLLGGLGASLSGGLGGIFSIGSNAALAGAGTATFATTLGAAIPVIGLAVAGISLLAGKTKQLDRGIRVTVDEMGTLVEAFEKTQTSRLFGLITSTGTSYRAADADLADPVIAAVARMQGGVLEAAAALAVGEGAFADFATQVRISTDGMSDEQALQAVREGLVGIADDMAEMIPGLSAFAAEGEGAATTLERLANSLTSANDAMDLLGHRLFAVSVEGAGAAAQMAEAFGGLDAMSGAVSTYFGAFYTEEERFDTTMRRLSDRLADLGVAMPATRDQFRAVVEAVDTTTEAGRELYAELLGLSGAIAEVVGNITPRRRGS